MHCVLLSVSHSLTGNKPEAFGNHCSLNENRWSPVRGVFNKLGKSASCLECLCEARLLWQEATKSHLSRDEHDTVFGACDARVPLRLAQRNLLFNCLTNWWRVLWPTRTQETKRFSTLCNLDEHVWSCSDCAWRLPLKTIRNSARIFLRAGVFLVTNFCFLSRHGNCVGLSGQILNASWWNILIWLLKWAIVILQKSFAWSIFFHIY